MHILFRLILVLSLLVSVSCKNKSADTNQSDKGIEQQSDKYTSGTDAMTLEEQLFAYYKAVDENRISDAAILANLLSRADFSGSPLGQGDIWVLQAEFAEALHQAGQIQGAIRLLKSTVDGAVAEIGDYYALDIDDETRMIRSRLMLDVADRALRLADWQYDFQDFSEAFDSYSKARIMRSRVYGFDTAFPEAAYIFERRFQSAKNGNLSFETYCKLVLDSFNIPFAERTLSRDDLEYWDESNVDCPPMGGMSQEMPQDPEFETLTVFYGTSRARTRKRHPDKAYNANRAGLSLGSIDMTVPLNREVGTIQVPGLLDFWGAQDGIHIVLKKIDSDADSITFQNRLAQHVSANKSQNREAFIYVHGHSVSFANAARRTAQLAVDLDMRHGGIFYSWPAGENVARYFKSQANVDHAARELQSFLTTVTGIGEIDTLHVIAHSMGNDVLSKALTNMNIQGYENKEVPFGQIIWASPDVDAKEFSQRVQTLKQRNISDGMTLYASEKDKALSVSQWIWDNFPRAGQAPPLSEIAQVIETVDTTQIDRKSSDLIAHGDFASSAIDDLRAVIWLSLMPSRRCELKQRDVDGITYWSTSPAESDCNKPLFREAVEIARMKLQPLEARTIDPRYFENRVQFVPMYDENGQAILPPPTPAETMAEAMLQQRSSR